MSDSGTPKALWVTRVVMAVIVLGIGWAIFASPEGRQNRMCEDHTSAYYQPDHPDCKDG